MTHALAIARFPAASVASSFWSVPRDVESDAARNLRTAIARATGLQDGGFLGNRWPGAQML
jgi:hypothetical protein